MPVLLGAHVAQGNRIDKLQVAGVEAQGHVQGQAVDRGQVGALAQVVAHVAPARVTSARIRSKTSGSTRTSSGVPAQDNDSWNRNYARFRQLDRLARRLQALERRLAALDGEQRARD